MVRRRFDEGERLMLAAKSLYERGGHEAEVVRVLDRLGILSMFRGEHDAAVSYREEALALQEHRYGSESATAALTRFRLGEAHLAAGHDEEAERLMRASLTVIEELHGPGMGTAHYHSRLGDVLARLGDAAGADAEHREAVRLLEAGLPASHHDWIYARENYARFLRSQGRHSEALVHMREVAANYEDMLGADHLRTRIAREAVQRLEERVSGG
jgi:tetratricopeptide (TPR) repeat protein